jgi:hypothetical protein
MRCEHGAATADTSRIIAAKTDPKLMPRVVLVRNVSAAAVVVTGVAATDPVCWVAVASSAAGAGRPSAASNPSGRFARDVAHLRTVSSEFPEIVGVRGATTKRASAFGGGVPASERSVR